MTCSWVSNSVLRNSNPVHVGLIHVICNIFLKFIFTLRTIFFSFLFAVLVFSDCLLFHIFFCEVFILALLYLFSVWRNNKRRQIFGEVHGQSYFRLRSEYIGGKENVCSTSCKFLQPLECVFLPESMICSSGPAHLLPLPESLKAVDAELPAKPNECIWLYLKNYSSAWVLIPRPGTKP